MTDDYLRTGNTQDTLIPKISVIVPAYNAELYLTKCLDSIFNQTFQDFEVIVVNDGSTDHTKQICEQYTASHQNMTIVNQENGGISSARNAGIETSKGEYIVFIDSDDYVNRDWLNSFISIFTTFSNCDMVIQGVIIKFDTREEHVSLPLKYYEEKGIICAYNELKKKSIDGFTHNKIYKKKIIAEHHLRFEMKLKEDLLFNYKYLSCISSLVITPSCCYHYVQHSSGSLIHRRYPADYMRELITAVRDAGLVLADKYHNTGFRIYLWQDYILAFSVLLFSMYQKNIGIQNRTERIKYIKEYQQIRRSHQDIKIQTESKAKQIFAMLMTTHPSIADFIMTTIYKYIT